MASTDFTNPPRADNAAAVPGVMSRDLQSAGSCPPPRAAGVSLSRRELAQRIRFVRRENIDWPAYYASRAMFWWTLAGFGFLFVGGMAGISQPGFHALGAVYLIFAGIFLAAFILNVPRLNRQEALYEKWRADCEGLRAIRAALAEGDTRPALGEAA